MKKLIILISLCILAITCSKKSTTEPDQKKDTILAAAEIGSQGGTVGDESFLLEVPPGAFDATHQIEVSISSDENLFKENNVSELYSIEGIPEQYAENLKIKIKYQEELSEETFIACGQKSYIPTLSDSVVIFQYLSCQDSAGYLLGEIPIPDDTSFYILTKTHNLNAVIKVLEITAVTNCAEVKIVESVQCTGLKPSIPPVEEAVLNAILKLQELKFIDEDDPIKGHVIQIAVEPFDPTRASDIMVYISHSINIKWSGIGDILYSKIVVDYNRVHTMLLTGQMCRVLFEILYQKELSPYHFLSGTDFPNNLWLHVATATWSETILGEGAKFTPARFRPHEDVPFDNYGLQYSSSDRSDHFDFGWGMSSLITHLVNDLQNKENFMNNLNIIYNLYNEVKKNIPEYHLSTLIHSIDSTVDIWWPSFIKDYLDGKIYDFPVLGAIQNISDSWKVDGPEDTLKTFSDDYYDISARLYKMQFSYDQIDSSAQLVLSITSDDIPAIYYKLIVYEYDGQSLNVLGEADDISLIIGNIRALGTLKRDLILAVVNSNYSEPDFDGLNSIQVTAEITEGDEMWCTSDCRVSAHMQVYQKIGTTLTDSTFFTLTFDVKDPNACQEGKFEFKWDSTMTDGAQDNGQVTIVYDPLGDRISSVKASRSVTIPSDPEETYTYNLEAHDLPVFLDNIAWLMYGVQGDSADQHVDVYTYDHAKGTWSFTLLDYWSDETSQIMVEFRK